MNRDAEDKARLRRITQGDECALSEMYELYGRVLYSLALRMIRSGEKSEDLVQDVFLHVWNHPLEFERENRTVYSLLVMMVRDRAVHRLRARDFKARIHEVDTSAVGFAAESRKPIPQTALSDEQQEVAGILSQISLEEQLVLSLAYYEGFSQSEIARKLNIPVATVLSRLKNALQSVRSVREDRK